MKQKIKKRALERIFVLVRDQKINLDQLIYMWANRRLKTLHGEIQNIKHDPRLYFTRSCNDSGGFLKEMQTTLLDADIDEILKTQENETESKAILSKIWSFI